MAKPYSVDLRTRVIEKHRNGKSVTEIIDELNVKRTFVYDMINLFEETGSIEPKRATGGRKPTLNEERLAQIEALFLEKPDITLQELKEALGLTISISIICDAVNKKLNLRYKKKTLHNVRQNDEDVQEARETWSNDQLEMDSSTLVFIDESSINIGMTRLYGRAKGEERVVDYIPDVRFDRVSILSSVRLNGELVPFTFSGTLNGSLFLGYVEKFLVPTLREGDIVIMDNASSHKVKGVAEAIESKGAFVMYLPTYSPDLNPIEKMWSKIKAYLRKVKARTLDTLNGALKAALDTITISDIKAWFVEANYSA